MSRRAVVVFNPAGGGGRAARMLPTIERMLAAAADRQPAGDRLEWEIAATGSAGDAARISARCAGQGVEVIVAAGGDGTLNETLNGMFGSALRLALLPLGTGNDFARTVGLYGDLGLAVETIFSGAPRRIDVGEVQGRCFLNVAGCGFDAAVADCANRGPRWLTGAPAYIAAALRTLARFRPADVRVTVDGEERELRAMMCSVANARTYGGGMQIAPDADLSDGLFDVCLLAEAGTLEFIRAFPSVFRGEHVGHPKVTMLRGHSVTIQSDPPMPLLVDGEVLGCTPAAFNLVPSAVEFLFPTKALTYPDR